MLKCSIGAFVLRDLDLGALPPTHYSKVSDEELTHPLCWDQNSWQGKSRKTFLQLSPLWRMIPWLFQIGLSKTSWTLAPFSDESESYDEQKYAIENMVTVRHSRSYYATPFWVGAITSTNGSPMNKIVVNWYELIQEDSNVHGCFSADSRKAGTISCNNGRYQSCTSSDEDPICDLISTKSVLITFESLTAVTKLPVRVEMLTSEFRPIIRRKRRRRTQWICCENERNHNTEMEIDSNHLSRQKRHFEI